MDVRDHRIRCDFLFRNWGVGREVPDNIRESFSEKAPFVPMSGDQKLDYVVELTDNILTQLGIAFVQVVKNENWTKRDLARITGLNETGIGHVLSGRRRNLTAETIAILARAMLKRPHLVLEDLRGPARAMAASARRGDKLRGPRAGKRPRRTGA